MRVPIDSGTGNKKWAGLCTAALLLTLVGCAEILQLSGDTVTGETLSTLSPAAGNADAALVRLRTQHRVRLADPTPANLTLDQLPAGSYGYVSGMALDWYIGGVSDLLRIHRQPDFLRFEVHRVFDGREAIVGYITAADRAKLSDPKRKNAVVTVFNIPYADTSPVAIDMRFIQQFLARNASLNEQSGIVVDAVVAVPRRGKR